MAMSVAAPGGENEPGRAEIGFFLIAFCDALLFAVV
jgi:hypothetical protein